jgi:two-component system, NarL family, nitrate/nitrite response regulator NarL
MKVFLIDDHTLFRTGLGALLKAHDIQALAAETVGVETPELIVELEPDIILLDLRMPDMAGNDLLKLIRQKGITIPVAILTTSEDENDMVECLTSGAQGYLLKNMDANELVNSLYRILEGEIVVDPIFNQVLARLALGQKPDARNSLEDLLTPREYEILTHVAAGESNKVIANKLEISDGTVKLHVKAILRKLEVNSRVEAAVYAVKQGIKAS